MASATQEMPVRWIPFIAFFLYVYIEISIFIQVAHVLGVLLTLILVIFTSSSACRWCVIRVSKIS